MKKLLLVIVLALMINVAKTNAQIYSPQLAGHNGVRTIFYPLGYYMGGVVNGIANGTGVFYWQDGSFFKGTFSGGYYNGPGVMVSRYGYIAGCWNGGVYVGQCVAVANPYNSDSAVKQVVNNVQQSRPQNSDYPDVSPEGYKITRIDPNTQMGQGLLGRKN